MTKRPTDGIRRLCGIVKGMRDNEFAEVTVRKAAVAEECDRLDEGVEAARRLLARLMPKGMEWPRFEDGAPVRIGDYFEDLGQVAGIKFGAGGVTIEGTAGNSDLFITSDERVKRPAPKVLDADGVEIREGDTVWTLDDPSFECMVLGFVEDMIHLKSGADHLLQRKPSQLTHERPVADTWERLEDDATVSSATYCERMGIVDDGGYSPGELMARDLVRRAKKLAGVSE